MDRSIRRLQCRTGASACGRRSSEQGCKKGDQAPDNQIQDPQTEQALGRSRGGLTTKFHLLAEGRGRPLAIVLSPGQAHDSPMLPAVLDAARVPRAGRGRPRKRPNTLTADKAYSNQKCRKALRERRIAGMIPARRDQMAHRKKQGRDGGRPCTDLTRSSTSCEAGLSVVSTGSSSSSGLRPAMTNWRTITSPA